MKYYLTVANHSGDYLHHREPYDSLDDAIAFVADHYLIDPCFARYWSGNVSIRDGRISRLLMRKSVHTGQLQENIDYVYIANEQALREIYEHDPDLISSA